MTQRSQILWEIMADHEWHAMGELVNAIADVVPPELAIRKGYRKNRPRLEAAVYKERGLRMIVRDLVWNWQNAYVPKRHIEVRGRGIQAECRFITTT